MKKKLKLDLFEELERRMKLAGVPQEEIDYWLRRAPIDFTTT